MSKQRQQHDGESDPVVSETYREIAQERTPVHLDHVVLNEARKAATTHRRREIAWLRPAAWVTTIGLCLAIVLEITDPVPRDAAPVSAVPASQHKESRGDAPALRMKRDGAPAALPERALSRDEDAANVADTPLPTAAGLETEESLQAVPSEEIMNEKTVPIDVGSVGRSDTMMLKGVEDTARMQEGTASTTFSAPAKAMSLAESESERYCDEQETSTPETWVECIMRLQQEDLHDEARFEHERLQETYPGANIPPLTVPLPTPP